MANLESNLSKRAQAAALSVGQIFASLASLGLSMALVRILDKTEYATFQQLLLLFQMLSPFLLMGLPQAIYYFFPTDESRRRSMLIECLALYGGAALFLSLFIYFGGGQFVALWLNNPSLEPFLSYFPWYVLSALLLALLAPVLVVSGQAARYARFNVFSRVCVFLMVVAVALASHSLLGVISTYIAVHVGIAICAVVVMLAVLPSGLARVSLSSLISVLRFSIPIGLASAIGVLFIQMDKFIVSSMVSTEEFAVYMNGAIEVPLITMITGAITAVVMADMRKFAEEKNHTAAIELFRLTGEKSSYLVFPIMLFLMVMGDAFIETLFTSAYAESVEPFFVYLLLLPLRTIVFGALIMALGQAKALLKRSLVAMLLNVGLSIFLVKCFGSIGAAIATVAVIWCWSVPYNILLIKRETKTNWLALFPWKHYLKVCRFLLVPVLLLVAVKAIMAEYEPIVRLAVGAIVFWSIVSVWLNGKVYEFSFPALRK